MGVGQLPSTPGEVDEKGKVEGGELCRLRAHLRPVLWRSISVLGQKYLTLASLMVRNISP